MSLLNPFVIHKIMIYKNKIFVYLWVIFVDKSAQAEYDLLPLAASASV